MWAILSILLASSLLAHADVAGGALTSLQEGCAVVSTGLIPTSAPEGGFCINGV